VHRRAGGSPLGEHPISFSRSRFVAEVARLLALMHESPNSGEFGYRKSPAAWNYCHLLSVDCHVYGFEVLQYRARYLMNALGK
jgi:hypothetical protein